MSKIECVIVRVEGPRERGRGGRLARIITASWNVERAIMSRRDGPNLPAVTMLALPLCDKLAIARRVSISRRPNVCWGWGAPSSIIKSVPRAPV